MFRSIGQVSAGKDSVQGCRKLFLTRITILVSLLLSLSGMGGCATRRFAADPLPPVMTQDELIRPYVKVGVVECSRERIGTPEGLTPEDQEWAHTELRNSARRLGADAVISVEIRLDQDSVLMIPTSSVRARGVAVVFR